MGAGAGIKLARRVSPSRLTELRHRPRRGPQVCSCSGSRHDRDGLTAPTPRAPSTAAEGGVGGYSSSVNFAGISSRGPYSGWSSQRKLPEWILPRSICSMSPSGISRAALIVVAPEPSPSSSALSHSSFSTASWAGGRDVAGVYDEALVDRQQVLPFDNKLGHCNFLLLDISNAQSPLNCC